MAACAVGGRVAVRATVGREDDVRLAGHGLDGRREAGQRRRGRRAAVGRDASERRQERQSRSVPAVPAGASPRTGAKILAGRAAHVVGRRGVREDRGRHLRARPELDPERPRACSGRWSTCSRRSCSRSGRARSRASAGRRASGSSTHAQTPPSGPTPQLFSRRPPVREEGRSRVVADADSSVRRRVAEHGRASRCRRSWPRARPRRAGRRAWTAETRPIHRSRSPGGRRPREGRTLPRATPAAYALVST